MTKVSKAKLLATHLPQDDHEVEGLGTIRVRGLSRHEALTGFKDVDKDVPGAFERRMLSMTVLDPELTEDEVGEWQRAAKSSEIDDVVAKINVMSGLATDAAKAAYKEFESNPDAEFRVPAGGEAVDDGGAPAG